MFEKVEDHLKYKEFFDDIKLHWKVFRDEAKNVIDKEITIPWHEEKLHNNKWDVFPIIWQRQLSPLSEYTNNSFDIVNKYSFVRNCGFSIMRPQCEIYPHAGYTNEVLRCHLGLIVPEGNCGIKVEDEVCNWREGDILFFDDTKLHSTWNKTDQMRVVLLVDLDK